MNRNLSDGIQIFKIRKSTIRCNKICNAIKPFHNQCAKNRLTFISFQLNKNQKITIQFFFALFNVLLVISGLFASSLNESVLYHSGFYITQIQLIFRCYLSLISFPLKFLCNSSLLQQACFQCLISNVLVFLHLKSGANLLTKIM